jgi:hypothetical protein
MELSPERSISSAEIKAFITGKRITGCVVCNHYDWRIKDDATAISCQCGEQNPGQPTPIGIVMLVCQNCGALEFHDRTVIARWLDCHRAKA